MALNRQHILAFQQTPGQLTQFITAWLQRLRLLRRGGERRAGNIGRVEKLAVEPGVKTTVGSDDDGVAMRLRHSLKIETVTEEERDIVPRHVIERGAKPRAAITNVGGACQPLAVIETVLKPVERCGGDPFQIAATITPFHQLYFKLDRLFQ